MKVLDYTEKESKEKRRAVDVESVLQDMENMEGFQGSIQEKIYEHWYALKQELLAALTAEEEKKNDKATN